MKIQDDKSIKQVLKPDPKNATSCTSDNFKNILSEVQSKIEGVEDKPPLRIDTLEKPNPSLQSTSALDRLQASNFNASLASTEGSKAKKEITNPGGKPGDEKQEDGSYEDEEKQEDAVIEMEKLENQANLVSRNANTSIQDLPHVEKEDPAAATDASTSASTNSEASASSSSAAFAA